MIASILIFLSVLFPSSFHHTQTNKIENAQYLQPFFEKLKKNDKPVRIVHLGDSHVRGHVFSIVTRRELEDAWGDQAMAPQKISYKTTAIATETGKPGLVYHTIGINGALYSHFNTETYLSKIKSLKPDLIILSFGTNEAHGSYTEEAHQQEMENLISALRQRCPNVIIMLTTPPGSYKSHRTRHRRNGRTYYTYQRIPNPNTVRVATTQREFAKQNKLPLWDLYNIVGGEQFGVRNWVSAGMMRNDRIHFNEAGYILMGKLLAEALINCREGKKNE